MDKPSIQFWRKDSGIELDDDYEKPHFFSLPAEIRTQIYSYVFSAQESYSLAFSPPKEASHTAKHLQDDYWASDHLQPLLTCRQFHNEANLLAFSHTTFVIRNPYTALEIPKRLSTRLTHPQISSIRNIAVVSEARHFRQMHLWKGTPFGVPSLQLSELTIVLHRSSYWHYLFDFNAILCNMLRNFSGADKVTFLRNAALVKPHFHTWVNRFVNLVLQTDRQERFGVCPPRLEGCWWSWGFDAEEQTAVFERRGARLEMSVEEYGECMREAYEWLRRSIEVEEYDHDPMSRNGF